ncbi:MAG: thiolase family protein [Acidimicrobiaceae bacterium]|nr:thiolase family protein [Acidimicrobiaceae bacterium]
MSNPNRTLSGKYAIVGVGQSDLGQVPGSSSLGLLNEAMHNAVNDAGLSKPDIDGIICRGPDDVYTHHQRMGELLGIDAQFSTTLDNGGASQILSIILAVMAIDAGMCDVVLCGYGRDSWSRTHRDTTARMSVPLVPPEQERSEFNAEMGMFGAVGMHALGASRHMALYGTSKDHLGSIAVAFREHALRNPAAQMKQPLSMEKYHSGRPIVDPFNMYDCSLVTDGAGAVVVCSAERAKDLRQIPVLISGFGTFNNLRGWYYDEHMTDTAARRSGGKAFSMAGIGPKEIDTAQLYDCFTYMVLTQLEDYGFCAKGEGGPFAMSGALGLDGALPSNTSGGQLSEGHVEGMLQILEGIRQLRHSYGPDRQVSDAQWALVSGHGGNTVCHSSLILQRGGA